MRIGDFMDSAITHSVDYNDYMTYQANLFDEYGDCFFDGKHAYDPEYEHDLSLAAYEREEIL